MTTANAITLRGVVITVAVRNIGRSAGFNITTSIAAFSSDDSSETAMQ